MKVTVAFMQGFTLMTNQLDIDGMSINAALQLRKFAISLCKLCILISFVFACEAYAGLDGAEIVSGQGVIVNSNLVQQDSARLAINAVGFGVKAGETFTLQQKFVTDIALIHVLGQNPSDILGSINAKGQLFISNPNGVLFGRDAQVNVGGLLATTLHISNENFMSDKYDFSGSGKYGSVINHGHLTATQHGYIALLAPEVRNEGVMSANLGTVLLAAADSVTLNLNNGALFGYTIDKGAFNAMAENRQLVQADGGQVFMGAKAADVLTTSVVNNSGTVRAQRVKNEGGVIRLLGDALVTNSGTLDASAANNGNGGKVELAGRFVALGGNIDASGQAQGGQVSVKASGNLSLASRVTATSNVGNGGDVRYAAGGAIIENSSSYTDVSGSNGGSIFVNADGGIVSSGAYRALGREGISLFK